MLALLLSLAVIQIPDSLTNLKVLPHNTELQRRIQTLESPP